LCTEAVHSHRHT